MRLYVAVSHQWLTKLHHTAFLLPFLKGRGEKIQWKRVSCWALFTEATPAAPARKRPRQQVPGIILPSNSLIFPKNSPRCPGLAIKTDAP